MYFYLGIDPGTIDFGWACLTEEGTRHASGVLKANKKAQATDRVFELMYALRGVLRDIESQGKIVACTIEQPFLRNGVGASALVLTGAYWGTLFLMRDRQVAIKTQMPNQLKALAGHGHMPKPEMIKAAMFKFDVTGKLAEHEADALWAAEHARQTFTEVYY